MASQVQLLAVPFTSDACVGEELQVRAVVNVSGEAINAAQGTLRYDPSQLRITSVRTGGSIFRFWQKQPTNDAQEGTVSFAGGLPTPGFTGDDGLLFTLNVVPLAADAEVRLSWESGTTVLQNDGAGTPAELTKTDAKMTVTAASSKICTALRPTPVPVVDTTPPEPFDVIITRTDDAFRGQYFASFYAYDKDSGVVRYELRENGEAWHTENSPYLLRIQKGTVILEVKAVDAYGHQRIASASADLMAGSGTDVGPWWFWLILLVAVGLGIWRFLATRRNTKGGNRPQISDTSSVIYKTQETAL